MQTYQSYTLENDIKKNFRKPEVHEEANEVINKEAEIETLTDRFILEQADDLNDDLFQDFTLRPLINDTEEDPINTEILEKESSEFGNYDREYRSYFLNFTTTVLLVWITKHII
ncbi:2953_t:CDS:2, partial [Cetraspora pellucida]